VPFVVRPADLIAVLGLTALLALACASYAARRAAAMTPIDAMRR
jgi:ABC-type lipoprotein release transport system permease subunit